MSMAKFRGSLFGKTLLLFLAVTYISCQNSLCPAAFTADRFNFKVEQTHLQKGRILGKVSFSDCRGPQRALFLAEDTRFKVDPEGTVSLNRAVTLHVGHKSFMLHAWDSKGKKLTTKVTVSHEVRRNEVDSIAPAQIRQTELTPVLPVLVFPQSSKGLKRRKRDWIIPPINFPENDRGPFPKPMVKIRSSRDKEVQLQYSITGPGADLDPKGLFIMDRITGWLSVTQPLDREGKDKYKLFAHAVAVGDGKTEDPMEIVINVIDQNDNKPEFTKDTFLGSVPESSPKGFEFMKVTAVDKDEPGSANSDIRYTLVSQDPQQPSPNMFVLNPLTGGLRLNSELDRENYPKYTLKIEASDMGGVGLTSVCTVIITVTGTNDPQFQKYMHIASVPENKVGAEVVKMLLTSDPHGSAQLPIYKIIDGNDEGFFKVHTGSKQEGIITTAKGLDFEKKSQHILSVSVVTNDNYQTSKARVILNVEDVNEAPLFNPAELVVVEPESVTAGSDLALYPAIDPDIASNQSIRYMACVDPSGWLDVNKENGLIKLKSAINRESPCVQGGKYKALILAIDDGEVPKTGTGTLVIELQGVSDSATGTDPEKMKACMGGCPNPTTYSPC